MGTWQHVTHHRGYVVNFVLHGEVPCLLLVPVCSLELGMPVCVSEYGKVACVLGSATRPVVLEVGEVACVVFHLIKLVWCST